MEDTGLATIDHPVHHSHTPHLHVPSAGMVVELASD